MSKRGIVISPPIHAASDGSVSIPSTEIDADDLRYYLVYWDELNWPEISLVKLGADDGDVTFLRERGILHRTRVQVPAWSGDTAALFAEAQAEVFERLNGQEPGAWSIAQPAEQLWLPDSVSLREAAIQVELYNAVPTPRREVSLEDILEFKFRRRDELLTFREHMDQLYIFVINSNDIPRARMAAIDKVERSISDLHRIMKESKMKSFLSSVKVDLNLSSAATGAALGLSTATVFDFHPWISVAVAGVVSLLKFETRLVPFTRQVPANLRDYAYVFHIERDLQS